MVLPPLKPPPKGATNVKTQQKVVTNTVPKFNRVATSSTPKASAGSNINTLSSGGGTATRTATTPSVASRSKGPIRGVTPTRRGAAAAAAAAGPVSYLPAGVPELDLSPEENLQIMERLLAGDFSSGDGLWSQFLDPIDAQRKKESSSSAPVPAKAPPKSQGPKCQQNLAGAFANLDLNQSNKNKTISAKAKATPDPEMTQDEDDPTYTPPLWMTRLQALIDAVEGSKSLYKRTISAILEAQFAEYLPSDQLTNFMTRMDSAMKSLEFLTTNFSETTRLFFQNAGNAKKAQLPVRVEEQEAFFGTMTQLSATLQRLDGFLMDSGKEINFQETVAEFGTLVDEIDKNLITAERQLKEVQHYSELLRNLVGKEEDKENWENVKKLHSAKGKDAPDEATLN